MALQALQQQYPEDYSFVSTNFAFKVPEDNTATAELQLLHPAVDRSHCIVGLEPKKGRVSMIPIYKVMLSVSTVILSVDSHY